ncbi:MAG: hypothetical protein A3G03_01610 [Candidatus Taylorbacteria bacterium RIFCSPLOWO2_12_FULL_44_15c]|uniref:Uncharacterized protein n=1 Tax=Candidatus Taylorbacteria bacterium RIFCSPLOWO2_12_FULL_44_15c TaxID=1802333 RepID=A0A1G2P7L5_9BACT|nr:MAG: hypothetical protein A3I97_01770 [Candidatus Taylorbacteria bacterium RIFCSPLOWO2_02_FULL_44_35]OHA44327.1 MAG: hypothetical protein A3G03_01610 [Candidatus Taylorbacteria bacterium RIFCSPLOWO2_12_FULL_44_15c]
MIMKVYFHEFNVLMGDRVYLPNVSGMLRAYAETLPQIAGNYEFMPFLFVRSQPSKIIAAWDNPAVLAFSSSMWNHELNLALAKQARQLNPKVLIVFGGPHIPAETKTFLEQNPFVDVAVLSEGEVTFAEVLTAFLDGRDFSKVDGLVYRHPVTGEIIRTRGRELVDINQLPSPYLAGFYDDFLNHREGIQYQMILETNRGCPFHCAFCYWGNGIVKVRTFEMTRLEREIQWLAEKKVSYVFGADANFGMLLRDRQIAELFVAAKQQWDFPKSFRVCFGKNATDRVFETAKVLEANGLLKSVTVSFQSTDPTTLANIGRSNIKISTYRELLKRYRRDKMPVYTELILGLPGETYESFKRGIEEVLRAGLYDQVEIYLCQVLPNTRMADPDYVLENGIQTKRLELVEQHALRRRLGEVVEYEEIVVATKSMPPADWQRAVVFAWLVRTVHGLKLGFLVALYLFNRFGIKYTELLEHLIEKGMDAEHFPTFAGEFSHFTSHIRDILSGKPQFVFLDEFGEISWQIEEATFLRISGRLAQFYQEFEILVSELLERRGIAFDAVEVSEVILYQSVRMASWDSQKQREFQFSRSLPEYFDCLLRDVPATIEMKSQTLFVETVDYLGDKKEFARQVVWFGRHDGRALLKPVSWR